MADQRWQLYGRGPEAYEKYLVPAFFGACADLLLAAVEVQPGERVLDVACGTGAVTRRLAQRVGPGGTVVGVDINENMIETARSIGQPTAAAPIEWEVADAIALPQADLAFDVVCCQQGMQYVKDRTLAVKEMVRALAPGGRLGLAGWRSIDHAQPFAILAQVLERHAGPEAAALMRAPFALTDPAEWRRLVGGAGLVDVAVHIGVVTTRFPSTVEFLRQQVSASPLAEPVGKLDPDRFDALARDLHERLAEHQDDAGLIFPLQTWLVTGRKL